MLCSWCSYLWLLLVEATIQLCFISTVACLDSHNDISLLPHDPEVEDGEWLTLNCTILPHYTGEYTNRDLYFRYGNVNFTNFTLVGSKTALLNLQWTLTDDGVGVGHIKCALPDRTLIFSAVQSVTVVRRPLQPRVTSCLLWNWKHVNCTWQPSIDEQQEHMHTFTPLIQTLQWKLEDEVNDVWQDVVCKGEVTNSCVWNVSHIVDRLIESDSCCVQVFARIHLNYLHFEVKSTQFCFRPAHNVVLDKPQNVTCISIGANQRFVQWQAPLNHINSTDFVYAVTVMSEWSDLPVINQSVVAQSLSFISIPHTKYAVTVKIKTNESRVWSKHASHNFTTMSTVPKMSPRSLSNAFTVSHVKKYTRTVIIYWKALSMQDYYGERLSYIVFKREPPASRWNELGIVKSANITCTEVNVNTDADVELTVIARNEVGDTLPDVVVHLPAVTTSHFTEFVVELTNDSTVVWSWQLKLSQHAGYLTLFWCRSRVTARHCAGSIQWQDIASSQLKYKLNISADDTNHYHYGAALKAGSNLTESSGIEWVECLYNASGLAAPAQDVQAFAPSFGDPGELLVTWVHPPCDKDYRHGYIKSFVLHYCRHAGNSCIDKPNPVRLPGNLTAYNLTGLEPGEEYSVWMYSWSSAGQSLTHSNVIVTVTSASVMTPAVIAGITVGSIVVLLLAVPVLWIVLKYCRRCRAKLWPPVTITVPSSTVQSNANTMMSLPILEYSRISYQRQGSRLSSSSRDSGQFGITGNSPLMSPEPESVLLPHDNHVEQRHQPHVDSDRPAVMTYVNDRVVVLRRPIENSHHQPSSPNTGQVECFPLQPMKPQHPHEAVANKYPSTDDVDVDNDEDESHVTDSLMNSRQNGGCDTVVPPRQHSDYVPHEWLKKVKM